jgi:hypothetical protein
MFLENYLEPAITNELSFGDLRHQQSSNRMIKINPRPPRPMTGNPFNVVISSHP